jgi:hydroxymethylglutaryl-CoA reductase (NADPH)
MSAPIHGIAEIPMRTIGPVKIVGSVLEEEVLVPLATLESPLWPSTNRGAKVSRECGGIATCVINEQMSRSIILEAEDAEEARNAISSLEQRRSEMEAAAESTSRYAHLTDLHIQIVGCLIYIRFAMKTGDASGHNMVTQATEAIQSWIMTNYPTLKYVSLSGNICTDKKVSSINGILGRGKYVVSDLTVSAIACKTILKTTPANIVELNIKKNLIGSTLSGGVLSANAHYANILLGFYLATGQDAANIVEGSQGITYAQCRGDDLYFSVTLPNVIVGTVGSGKQMAYAEKNLELLGCRAERGPGENARRLAAICGAAVLCGELSLMAALTNPGELMRAHRALERKENE